MILSHFKNASQVITLNSRNLKKHVHYYVRCTMVYERSNNNLLVLVEDHMAHDGEGGAVGKGELNSMSAVIKAVVFSRVPRPLNCSLLQQKSNLKCFVFV